MMRRMKDLWVELKARRRGRQAMGNDKSMFTAARGIVGITGNSFSNAWDLLERDGDAYLKSMQGEQHLPPSLFVSERDRIRNGQATPLPERCIEDHGDAEAIPVREWNIADLDEV
ncbi:MAG: hypothetical protein ACR2P0_02030 [Acidimicrobiales bacterium]